MNSTLSYIADHVASLPHALQAAYDAGVLAATASNVPLSPNHLVLRHLGGARFVAALGAHDFRPLEDGLQMRLPRIACTAVNGLRVRITPVGSYDVAALILADNERPVTFAQEIGVEPGDVKAVATRLTSRAEV